MYKDVTTLKKEKSSETTKWTFWGWIRLDGGTLEDQQETEQII